MCESCLSIIQQHVIERIEFPDMANYPAANPMDAIEEWHQAARLLRGEELFDKWHAVGIHLNPSQQPPSGLQRGFVFNNYYSTKIADKTYRLGIVTMQVASIQVDPIHPPVAHNDHIDVRFIPGDDDAMTIRMVSRATAISSS